MKRTFGTTILSLFLLGQIIACQAEKQISESDANNKLLIGLLAGQASESSKDFALNGVWNSFTGNGTTLDTISTYSAKSGSKGLQLDDSSGFGGYSSCYIIIEFNNAEGSFITQNPENNGGCFAGDTNKGKYNKVFFFKNTAKENSYWICTVAFGKTYDVAKAQADTTTKTNPGSSGCGASAFSRIDKKI
ncbi:hypothetical protein ND856_01005 [Leptospira bandrabouensis]|uniref:hypothetical protein n=1 Tax=Leptospira bandrabouensis TaxID=2484903 RepID=UPI001EE840E7|nr:hypothetical protein [Leptospira bandrabouensis]MCG6144396.1 hypothetical protein [Leptospira bandrabouensis]MCG6160057.1 hypothetical protein [Leptospira bandrabouensis]MCG6163990.1 hypothetical protein [Leptospira bandrabouensis]MCW7456901.1 hypothetical protein [Leptospira bandrabouensis]MCW7475847.1 hypothetical protein [Leptospira bandrabouensis]